MNDGSQKMNDIKYYRAVLNTYGKVTHWFEDGQYVSNIENSAGSELLGIGDSEIDSIMRLHERVRMSMWRRVTRTFWLATPLP